MYGTCFVSKRKRAPKTKTLGFCFVSQQQQKSSLILRTSYHKTPRKLNTRTEKGTPSNPPRLQTAPLAYVHGERSSRQAGELTRPNKKPKNSPPPSKPPKLHQFHSNAGLSSKIDQNRLVKKRRKNKNEHSTPDPPSPGRSLRTPPFARA